MLLCDCCLGQLTSLGWVLLFFEASISLQVNLEKSKLISMKRRVSNVEELDSFLVVEWGSFLLVTPTNIYIFELYLSPLLFGMC